MRDIKFRAWIDDYGKMIQVAKMEECVNGIMHYFTKYNDSGYYDLDNPKNALMQLTGLPDKNGKEIYEGDIIQICDRRYSHQNTVDNYLYGVVEYVRGGFIISGSGVLKPLRDFTTTNSNTEKLEVIGNIYENPE